MGVSFYPVQAQRVFSRPAPHDPRQRHGAKTYAKPCLATNTAMASAPAVTMRRFSFYTGARVVYRVRPGALLRNDLASEESVVRDRSAIRATLDIEFEGTKSIWLADRRDDHADERTPGELGEASVECADTVEGEGEDHQQENATSSLISEDVMTRAPAVIDDRLQTNDTLSGWSFQPNDDCHLGVASLRLGSARLCNSDTNLTFQESDSCSRAALVGVENGGNEQLSNSSSNLNFQVIEECRLAGASKRTDRLECACAHTNLDMQCHGDSRTGLFAMHEPSETEESIHVASTDTKDSDCKKYVIEAVEEAIGCECWDAHHVEFEEVRTSNASPAIESECDDSPDAKADEDATLALDAHTGSEAVPLSSCDWHRLGDHARWADSLSLDSSEDEECNPWGYSLGGASASASTMCSEVNEVPAPLAKDVVDTSVPFLATDVTLHAQSWTDSVVRTHNSTAGSARRRRRGRKTRARSSFH